MEWDSRLQQGLCPSDRAVTSSLVSQFLTEHRTCFLTPGGVKYSEATFSGSTWAWKTFPAHHWIITIQSALPSLVPITVSCLPLLLPSLPGRCPGNPALLVQASAATPTIQAS